MKPLRKGCSPNYHYKKKWEKMHEFKDWLKPYVKDITKAFCEGCNEVINADLYDLLKHGASKKHSRYVPSGQIVSLKMERYCKLQNMRKDNESSEEDYSELEMEISKKWANTATECLVQNIKKHWADYTGASMEKKDFWEIISNEMEVNEFYYNGQDCEKQFENIKQIHYDALFKTNLAEQLTEFSNPYFNDLLELLSNDPETLEILDQSNKPSHEQASVNEKLIEIGQIPSSNANTQYRLAEEGDMKWTGSATDLFLEFLLEFQDIYTTKEEDCKSSMWETLSNQLSLEGYPVNDAQCLRKWKSMVSKFNDLKTKSERTGILPLWPHYTQVRCIIDNIDFPDEETDWNKSSIQKKKDSQALAPRKRMLYKKRKREQAQTSGNRASENETFLDEAIKEKSPKQKSVDNSVIQRIQQLSEDAKVWDRLSDIENRLHDLSDHQEQQALTNNLLGQILTEVSLLASYLAPKNSQLRGDITLVGPLTDD